MRYPYLAAWTVIGALLLAPAFAAAQSQGMPLRTAWGDPDLQGVWRWRRARRW